MRAALTALPLLVAGLLAPAAFALPTATERCMDCYITTYTMSEITAPTPSCLPDPFYPGEAPGGGGGWAGAERAAQPAPTDIGEPIVDPPLCSFYKRSQAA